MFGLLVMNFPVPTGGLPVTTSQTVMPVNRSNVQNAFAAVVLAIKAVPKAAIAANLVVFILAPTK